MSAISPSRVAIIGGGLAGLTVGHYLRHYSDGQADFVIFEQSERPGGTIGITCEDGFTADWGPNGFLDKEPLTLELVEQLGLTDRLVVANEKAARRFIYRGGRLHEMFAHPAKFLSSGPLSLAGRLRVPLEYFIRPRSEDTDETIHAFASRRIGKEAADYLITPMVTGIFGGDARQLSLPACFPMMRQMEREYGGLIKAMIQKKRQNKGKGKTVTAGPSGKLTTFQGGCYTLIERLAETLSAHLRLSTPCEQLEQSGDTFQVHIADGPEEFDAVILAVPAHTAARLLEAQDVLAASLLRETPYCSMTVVCHGYRRDQIDHPLDGFGFLIPPGENLSILGSIWTSVIFPEQAPADSVLFRTMIGGSRNPGLAVLPEEKATELAHQDLAELLSIQSSPCFVKVIRWEQAIPQYTLGHLQRLEQIEQRLSQMGRLYLAGNAYTGIGMNDVVKRSHRLVTEGLLSSAGAT